MYLPPSGVLDVHMKDKPSKKVAFSRVASQLDVVVVLKERRGRSLGSLSLI